MNYTEALFTVDPLEPGRDILVAELAEAGFESFEFTDNGVKAYILNEQFNEKSVAEIIEQYKEIFKISWSWGEIVPVNWNEEWERNYSPVVIDEICGIRAPFHDPGQDLRYDIVIEPKMSFGTAHHETTALMIRWLLEMDVAGKSVLDMGCGTGVLAVLAAMKGAEPVVAMDNYIWAYTNTIENAERNGMPQIEALHGDASLLEQLHRKFDVILANINRNVLVDDMNVYVSKLNSEGVLLMSGFLADDAHLINEEAVARGMKKVSSKDFNNWTSVLYKKQPNDSLS